MVKRINKTNRYFESKVGNGFKFIRHEDDESTDTGTDIYEYGDYTIWYDEWKSDEYEGKARQVTARKDRADNPYIFMNDRGSFSISCGFTARSIGDAKEQVANIQEAIKVADTIKKEFNF